MFEFIVLLVCGVLILILGIMVMNGNLSLIHSYHIKRVSQENIRPFCKIMGLGTLLNGVGIIVYGIFSFIAQKFSVQTFNVIGTVFLIIGLVFGLVLILYALIKYNKGIF